MVRKFIPFLPLTDERLAHYTKLKPDQIRLRGFHIFADRHGIMRCYHRRTNLAVDVGKYPFGSRQFFERCIEISVELKANKPVNSRTYVYLFRALQLVKIGVSQDVQARFKTIKNTSGKKVSISAWTFGTVADERSLHERFKAFRRTGEWFKIEGELATFMERPYDNLLNHIMSRRPHAESMGEVLP